MRDAPGPLLGRALPRRVAPALRVLDHVEARLDRIADDIVDGLWQELPGYARQTDPVLRARVRAGVLETCRLGIRLLARGEPAAGEELAIIRDHTGQPAGVSPPEVVRAYQIGLAVIWSELEDISDVDGELRGPALTMLGRTMQVVLAIMGSHIGALHDENARLKRVDEELVGREVFERLIAGQPLATGPQREMASRAGLREGEPLAAVSVRVVDPTAPADATRLLVAAIRASRPAPTDPLTVVLDDEVVSLVAVTDGIRAPALTDAMHTLADRLQGIDGHVAVGISTVHRGTPDAGAALAEARAARVRAGRDGCVAFCQTSALEYLVSGRDETAERMVRASFRSFVEDDVARGGGLVMTLRAYVAADLNATLTAERLHMHINTVRYRLTRIEERAGCDLRKLSDVLELFVATRLHQQNSQHT